MNRPQDRNLEDLLAASLLQWTRGARGWVTRDGSRVERFKPLQDRDDARRVVERMEALGFVFEDRPVDGEGADEQAVVASFYRGGETYSSLATSECQAICTAASRFVMSRAGQTSTGNEARRETVKTREE